MPRSGIRYALPITAALALLAACAPAAPAGSPGSSTSATSSPSNAASASASAVASPTASASAASASPSATPKATGTAQVDLKFTGAYPFTAKGTSGECPSGFTGAYFFSFGASESDYPGMGQSFSLVQFNPASDYVDLKWLIDNDHAYGQAGPVYTGGPNTIKLSADRHTATLDAQLSGLAPQGKPAPGPEHITGTITCP